LVLDDIKKYVGIEDGYTGFDFPLLVELQATLHTLSQLGVTISNETVMGIEEWEDVIAETDSISSIKSYVCLKVKMVFDPPANTSILENLTARLRELESRILISCDRPLIEEGV